MNAPPATNTEKGWSRYSGTFRSLRGAFKRFRNIIRSLGRSYVGTEVKVLFAALILCLFAINGLNVLNSYVGRDFMTAIENKNWNGFVHYAAFYAGVFVVSTIAAVNYRWCEERLGLVARKWLTERAIEKYVADHTYFRMNVSGALLNPDQRISEDIRALTATTLSFILMLLNATLTVLSFSGVMWSISPTLFLIAVLYAAIGSLLTYFLGRPLIKLNYDQLDKEANFRSRLVHVRENADPIALLGHEDRLRVRLHDRLDQLALNFRRIINVNRNLAYFTTGYNFFIQVLPALIVAPLFIKGDAQFGVITQSAMAFGHLIGAFSLIVTQFQSISSYTAVIARLEALANAFGLCAAPAKPDMVHYDGCGHVSFEGLNLNSPRSGRQLVKDLNLSIPAGTRVLIHAPNESARSALFRATAGLWDPAAGRIVRPQEDDMLFLPERPYVPPGTLRQILLQSGKEKHFSDERILLTLRTLNLVPAVQRAGGLDRERNWTELLSLGEQQLLAFARVLLAEPTFVFIDHPSRSLTQSQVDELLKVLRDRDITYLTLGEEDDDTALYDQLLTIAHDGTCTLKILGADAGSPTAPDAGSGNAVS